jgi:RNA polymerase sigma-70 factor (ECF subfamily)
MPRELDVQDDFTVLQAWRAGDAAAGDELFRRHFATVHRFFHNKVSRDLDDLVQDTLLGLLKSQHSFENRGSFKAYLLGVARYRLYEHYRCSRRDGERLEFETVTLYDIDPSPSVIVVERSEERLMLQALRHLPVNLQIALELTYWEDMPAPQIAEVLDIPTDTVYSRVRRGKELLRKELARLAISHAQQSTTQSDLEAWAQSIRAQIPAAAPSASQSHDPSQAPSEATSKVGGN